MILAHKNSQQIKWLCEKYKNKNIFTYIHIDKKANINIFCKEFDGLDNIKFLNDRISINWGGWSMVKATLNLMETAIINKHDYYFLISGEDISVKSYNYIKNFLNENETIFIEYNKLPYDKINNKGINRYERYYFGDFVSQNRLLKKIFNKFFYYLHKLYQRKLPNKLTPYYGSQWFTLPHYCVSYILKYIKDNKNVCLFFRKTHIPDEMFFQTIILNSHLKSNVINDNLRYIKWDHDQLSPHPNYLSHKEIKELNNSEFIFARKYRML